MPIFYHIQESGVSGKKLDKDAINDLQNALALLSVEQASMCKKINKPDVSQDCLMRHYIVLLLKSGQDSGACERIFVDRWENECVEAAANGQARFLIDEDANNLLDDYEIIAFSEIIE